MELCDKTLKKVINEFHDESHLKTNGMLTIVGYYIASKVFLQILEGVNHLHKQNSPLIHRDLKPTNILLKKMRSKRVLCQNRRHWTYGYPQVFRTIAYYG